MALDYDPFENLAESAFTRPERPKTDNQLAQLVYSHLLTAKVQYEQAEDGNEVSDIISGLNSALAKRDGLVGRDDYERTCQQFLRDVFGRGYV